MLSSYRVLPVKPSSLLAFLRPGAFISARITLLARSASLSCHGKYHTAITLSPSRVSSPSTATPSPSSPASLLPAPQISEAVSFPLRDPSAQPDKHFDIPLLCEGLSRHLTCGQVWFLDCAIVYSFRNQWLADFCLPRVPLSCPPSPSTAIRISPSTSPAPYWSFRSPALGTFA